MARIVFGIIAVVASFMLAESLTCNKCSVGLVGLCLIGSEETCSGNSSVCFKQVATFPSVSSFSGLNSQGCMDGTTGCNATTNGTLLGVTYEVTTSCCSTDKCSPVTSGAPSTKMTLTTAMGAALLISVLGSML